MKKVFSSIAAVLIFAASYSQSGYSYKIINNENVRKRFGPITSDNNGNTIISGQFETTITFGSITLTNSSPSPGSYNTGFVAKELPNGSFAWAKMLTPKSIPNGISWITIYGINTDASGNIYLTGNFIGKIDIGNNITLTSSKSGTGYSPDIFTVKMLSNGSTAWGKTVGTTNEGCNSGETGRSIATDNAGNIYTTGEIVNQVFNNTNVCNDICPNSTFKSITCPIVIKYNAAGQKVWEVRFPSTSAVAGTSCWYNHPGGTDIRTDGTNIYVAGYFYGTTNFGNGTLSTGSETISNIFLVKLNTNGVTLWAKSVTGGVTAGYGVGDGLFVNGNDIYLRGLFYSGTISLSGCTLTYTSSRGFLAKVFSDGNCSWMQTLWGTSYGTVPHPDGNLAMLLRRTGSPYPVGGWYGIKELSPVDGSATDSTEISLADTVTGSVWGYPSIAQLPDGFIFSQHIQGTLHFGDLTITSTGSADNMMLIRYTTTPPPVAGRGNIIAETSLNKIVLYPNPTSSQITIHNNNNNLLGTVSIYDISGKMIYKKFIESFQTTIDVKNFSTGVYCIRSDQLQATIKFVKQ